MWGLDFPDAICSLQDYTHVLSQEVVTEVRVTVIK